MARATISTKRIEAVISTISGGRELAPADLSRLSRTVKREAQRAEAAGASSRGVALVRDAATRLEGIASQGLPGPQVAQAMKGVANVLAEAVKWLCDPDLEEDRHGKSGPGRTAPRIEDLKGLGPDSGARPGGRFDRARDMHRVIER